LTLQGALWVGAGGFLGATARYLLALWVDARFETPFPVATLLINVSGSFVLGTLSGALEFATMPPEFRLALGVGFLGAYTTFSTFTYETLRLVEGGDALIAFGYVAASVVAGLGAAVLGLALGRSF
jgi:fluoride exporter